MKPAKDGAENEPEDNEGLEPALFKNAEPSISVSTGVNCSLVNICMQLFTTAEEDDDELLGPPPPPEDIPEISLVKRVEVEIQERRDTRPGVPHVREWDRGKGKHLSPFTTICQPE